MNTPAMDRLCGDKAVINHIDCPFKDDSIDVDADYFYDVADGTVIDILSQVDTTVSKDFIFGVTCDDHGVYEMEFTATSDLNELAQIPMTVYFTSIPFHVLTWNGTEGREDTRSAKIIINSRHVVLRAHMGSLGVRLKSLRFKYLSPITEEAMAELFGKKD